MPRDSSYTPPSSLPPTFDAQAARELELFIDNDADLYRQMNVPIQHNLERKMFKGTYDPERAVQGFQHLADEGARRYTAQFGTVPAGQRSSVGIFDKPTREHVARRLTSSFEAERKAGNFLLERKAKAARRGAGTGRARVARRRGLR